MIYSYVVHFIMVFIAKTVAVKNLEIIALKLPIYLISINIFMVIIISRYMWKVLSRFNVEQVPDNVLMETLGHYFSAQSFWL